MVVWVEGETNNTPCLVFWRGVFGTKRGRSTTSRKGEEKPHCCQPRSLQPCGPPHRHVRPSPCPVRLDLFPARPNPHAQPVYTEPGGLASSSLHTVHRYCIFLLAWLPLSTTPTYQFLPWHHRMPEVCCQGLEWNPDSPSRLQPAPIIGTQLHQPLCMQCTSVTNHLHAMLKPELHAWPSSCLAHE